jgi:hypothetical protein
MPLSRASMHAKLLQNWAGKPYGATTEFCVNASHQRYNDARDYNWENRAMARDAA